MKNYSIVIDTNCFGDTNKYDFKNGKMAICVRSFKSISNINVFMPSIAYEELKKHIDESIRLSIQDIKSVYLKNYLDENQIRKIYQEQVKNIDDFIKQNNIKMIDCNHYALLKEVNEWYFNSEFPFEAKKKYEFPDAIIISGIKNYFEVNKSDEVIVISNDNGFKKGINNHTSFKIESDIVNIMKNLLNISDMEIRKCIDYVRNNNLLSKLDTYKIESIDSGDYYDISDIEYNINDYEIISKEQDNYLLCINCDIVLEGEFNLVNQEMSVYDYEMPECSAIFTATGNKIKVKDFDVFITLYKDEKGFINNYDIVDVDSINLSDYVNQLSILE